MTVTFFGHTDFLGTAEYERKMLTLLDEVVGCSAADFYLGGIGGFDSFAYDCCKKYKQTHSNARLIFVTPYMTEDYQRAHLKRQREMYDEIIYPEIEDKPIRFAILYRNKWMVDQADVIICAVAHAWGGAYKACKYATDKKKRTLNLINS